MRDIIYRCDSIEAEAALRYGLVNDVADTACLLEQAVSMARSLARYPQTAFRNTKRLVNQTMIDKLEKSSAGSKQVHRAAFAAREAQPHFRTILKQKYGHAG
jgi:carboxymethylproline synthase